MAIPKIIIENKTHVSQFLGYGIWVISFIDVMVSGVPIHRELDFWTQVRILASTSIPLETPATKNKETMEDVVSGQ